MAGIPTRDTAALFDYIVLAREGHAAIGIGSDVAFIAFRRGMVERGSREIRPGGRR
jgi:hypothetical protein